MSVSPDAGGTLEIDGEFYTPYPHVLQFGIGETVELVASPAAGYIFTGWSGDITGDDNPAEITMLRNEYITANFSRSLSLDIKIKGGGVTNPAAGSYIHPEGETVTIVAKPDFGWRFDGWSGDVSDSESSTTLVNMNNSKEVTANFVKSISAWLIKLISILAAAFIVAAVCYVIHRKPAATRKEPA